MQHIERINENQTIKQSNRLIEARYNLTVYEQRMMIAICSQLDKNAEDFERVRVSVAEMAKFCDFEAHKGYTLVKATIMRLLTRTLQIKHEDGSWYATHWLQSAKYIPSESIIEYRVDSELKPELLQLKAAYLETKAAPLMQFNRDYSARLYFLLKKMLKIGDFEYDLDFFRDRFVLSKAYRLFANMKNKVLDPALKEINEKSDIKVEYEYIKEGRSYQKIRFSVRAKDAKKLPSTKKETLDEKAQKAYDMLVSRGVTSGKAKALTKKYSPEIIEKNLRYAVKQKDSAKNLPGLIINFIENDVAGENEKEKKAAKERQEQRQKDKIQAYNLFHETPDESAEIEHDKPVPVSDELNDFEAQIIIKNGEKAGKRTLAKMKKLGLTIEDVRNGKRKK